MLAWFLSTMPSRIHVLCSEFIHHRPRVFPSWAISSCIMVLKRKVTSDIFFLNHDQTGFFSIVYSRDESVNSLSQKNSRSKAIFNISQNHVSHQFEVVKSQSRPFSVTLVISHEITQKFACFSLYIMENGESYGIHVSRMVKCEIKSVPDSRKLRSLPLTISGYFIIFS